MRTILCVGALCGALGAGAVVALQPVMGLGIIRLILLVGFCAGLGVAKWLERSWYGRQLAAGLRGGAIASGSAGAAALAALVAAGPHDTAALLAQSDFSPLAFPSPTQTFSALSWIETDIIAVAVAVVLGAVIAALVTQLIAWSKSRRAVQVVEHARLAAQALVQGAPQLPAAPASPQIAAATVFPLLGRPTGVPLATPHATGAPSPTAGMRPTGAPAAVPPRRTLVPMPSAPSATSRAPAARQQHTAVQTPPPAPGGGSGRGGDPAPSPAAAAASVAQPLPPRARRSSSARPVEHQLTDEMRAALAAWAEEHGTSDKTPAVSPEAESSTAEPAPAAARTPQASKYLNAPGPKPRRNRKKNQTRDWIC